MRLAKTDPDEADRLSGSDDSIPYTVEQYRAEIRKLTRNAARIQNLIRLASSLSTEAKVKTVLSEAEEIR